MYRYNNERTIENTNYVGLKGLTIEEKYNTVTEYYKSYQRSWQSFDEYMRGRFNDKDIRYIGKKK